MPFRFKPWAQMLVLLLVSAIALRREGAAVAMAQLYMIGGVGSLLLQVGNMTVGGSREPGGPMSPRQIALTFALGFALCLAGTFALELLFGSGIIITADTIDRIPYETMRNPHMGLILSAWNLLVLTAGYVLALILIGGLAAAFEAARKSWIKRAPNVQEPGETD